MTLNRIVAVAAAVSGLLAAVLVPLADLDWSSTAGVLGGLAVVATAAVKWLDGWQKHEERSAYRDHQLDDREWYALREERTAAPLLPKDDGGAWG